MADSERGEVSQDSVAALAPAATSLFTHVICGRCHVVLRGDLKTIARVGANVDASAKCPQCESAGLVKLCMACPQVETAEGWRALSAEEDYFLRTHPEVEITHGECPSCASDFLHTARMDKQKQIIATLK